jgi:hypothetical protein
VHFVTPSDLFDVYNYCPYKLRLVDENTDKNSIDLLHFHIENIRWLICLYKMRNTFLGHLCNIESNT